MASSSSTSLDLDQEMDEATELLEYQKAMSAICKNLTPDTLTGELEFTDIFRYIDTHVDDPDVQNFFKMSEKRRERAKGQREQALANFDINKLSVSPGTSWYISLQYAGLTTDKRSDDKWYIHGSKKKVEPQGNPQQQFQLYCYIRERPGLYGGDNSRHVEEFIGLPTSQQIEDFIKICMACPIDCYEPCIPSTLGFHHNLTQHKASLKPFLDSLPWSCYHAFERSEVRNRMQEEGYEDGARKFRQYIEHATAVKDVGNAAYARGDPADAIAQYSEAIEVLEKLLLKSISEAEDRDRETRTLVAVCWANSSAAKMLEVSGNEKNLQGATLDAENAITSDPGYAKGYIRLCQAHERLGNISAAKDALVRGLRQKSLEDHFGLADYLIFLQTEKKGLPQSKDEYELWLKNTLVDNRESAERMGDLGGAWKTRCRIHGKNIGV